MAIPSSSMASISAVVGRQLSGASMRLDVVPKIETVPAGTKMSASAALRSRLMTRSLIRIWLITKVP